MNKIARKRIEGLKNDVRSVLTYRVRIGFFRVPLWVLASALVLRQVVRHRRAA